MLSKPASGFPATLDSNGVWLLAFIEADSATNSSHLITLTNPTSTSFYISLRNGFGFYRDVDSGNVAAIGRGTVSQSGTHVLAARVRLVGSDVQATFLRDADAPGTHTQPVATTSIAEMTRLSLGALHSNSTATAPMNSPVYGFAWGTGDPASLVTWLYNGGSFGRDPADYNYAGDTACALIGTELGTRAGDGTPFESSDLDETWDETGTVAWASATPAF